MFTVSLEPDRRSAAARSDRNVGSLMVVSDVV